MSKYTYKPAIKRLFIDCETSPNTVLSWRIGYKINLDYSNIIKERAIICAAWRWEGETKVHSATWDSNQCDRALLAKLIPILNEADEIVAHNGDRFDVPWLRTRVLFHGLPPISPYIKTVDTLQWARRQFLFNSNRLDYLGKFLGLGCKMRTEFDLWKRVVLKRDPKALQYMVKYCCGDISLLEDVFHKLAPMVRHKTHAGVAAGGDKWTCPVSGSLDVHLSKTRVTAGGTKQYQMLSRVNGRYFTINETAYQAYREAKGL